MHLPETYRPWIYVAGAFVAYLLMMFTNPARQSLRDGWRCLLRYRALWTILALFGLCYAVFQIGLEVCDHYNLPEGARPEFQWSRPWFLTNESGVEILKASVLPALESVAGVFNVLVTTFPFSAIAAIFFFMNWEGHHAELLRALRRRFDGFGWLIYAGILLCAAAALVKPFLYSAFLLQAGGIMSPLRLLQCSLVVDWLSFLFEIMFGIGVQIYLILMVYAWVRGLTFTHRHLMDFAIRRFSFVMKWSGIVMLLSTLFIHLPLILSYIPPFTHYIQPDTIFGYLNHWVRPVLAAFLILFSGMQIILTFHSESLGKAVRDLFYFLRKDAWPASWYLAVAFLHFYVLTVMDKAFEKGQGGGTALAFAWRLLYPLLAAYVGGWLLASWVCLYKRSEAGRIHAGDWIKY
jgi:hypothetical protein